MKKLQTTQHHGGYNLFEAMLVTGVMAVLSALYLPNLLGTDDAVAKGFTAPTTRNRSACRIYNFMKLPSHSRRTKAFTFWELLIVIAITGILLLVFLPALAKSKARSKRINCTNHLKQIGLSFKQWALDNGDKYPMQVSVTNGGTMELIASGNVAATFIVMSNELNTPKILFCPQELNSTRTWATMFGNMSPPGATGQISFTRSNLSYFVGADATDERPQTVLSGDDNLVLARLKLPPGLIQLSTNSPIAWTSQRHSNQGNILLADGSVQLMPSVQMRAAFAASGLATNRLLLP